MTDEKIVLNLNETNELLLKVAIKGSSKEPSAVRLVFENLENAYVVKGKQNDDGMHKFIVPSMENKGFDEGTYKALVEVIIDGRYFIPIQFDANFVRPMSVQVETIQQATHSSVVEQQQINVEASMAKPVVKQQHTPQQQPKPQVLSQQKQPEKAPQKAVQVKPVAEHIKKEAIKKIETKKSVANIKESAPLATKSKEMIKMKVKDFKKLIAESFDVNDDEFSAKEQEIIDAFFRRKR